MYSPGYCRIRSDQGFLENLQEGDVEAAAGGVGKIIPQKFKGASRIAARLQGRDVAALVRLDGPGLAVVGEDPGLPPEVQGEGVGVALVHLAAGTVADMGQDDGAGHHPGQALEGAVQLAVLKDLISGFLHDREVLAEEADAPAVHVAAPPGGEQGQGGGGAMAMGGAQGKQVAHLQVPLIEEIRSGDDEDLAAAPVRDWDRRANGPGPG